MSDPLFFTHLREAIQVLGPQRYMTKEESAAMNEFRMREATPVKMVPDAEYDAMQTVVLAARQQHSHHADIESGVCIVCDAIRILDSLKTSVAPSPETTGSQNK